MKKISEQEREVMNEILECGNCVDDVQYDDSKLPVGSHAYRIVLGDLAERGMVALSWRVTTKGKETLEKVKDEGEQ